MPLLDIRNLTIDIITPTGRLKVVDRITLTLSEGEFRGIVGESGSGKSLIAKVICGLTNENWIISADRFRFNNIELLKLSPSERRKLVGRNISMIFQEPQSCLDPAEHIGKQLTQAIPSWTYKGVWYKRFGWRKKRAIALLHRVGIKEHHDIMKCYPHQLTEGECQKVMIAIALANQPRLLIADEPTNAMESTTQAQIFRLLASMNQNNHTTILLISHNLEMMVGWASRVSVLYCGQMVEIADSQELLKFPQHPYTLALIRSTPELVQSLVPKSPLNTIPGSIPALENLPIGCRFGPRCPYAQKNCMQRPKLSLGKNHAFACHYPLNTESGG